ncbi:MAG: GNAT family N-acetyltransferase [Lachnospiraceae bacterium]|nr:GNAT family N-acetyltransferase [Lachnospiraceae bacterium]
MLLVEIDALNNEEYLPLLPEELIRADLENDALLFFGAQTEGEPVGTLAAELLPDAGARLRHIYLKEELRGKGLGEAMFDLMMDEFPKRGIDRCGGLAGIEA